MKRRLRKFVTVAVGLFALLVLAGCLLGPDIVGQMSRGKYEPVSEQTLARPQPTATTPTPEVQTEPHTCGLHAMRSLYAAYGLNPDVFKLRFRLGTDAPAMRIDSDSTGTLHPDLYRVLGQDGFAADAMDLDAADADARLQAHLEHDQLALALVYRSTYHWVLLSDHEDAAQLTVIDSLATEPFGNDIHAFINETALSITLVRPSSDGAGNVEAHHDGIDEMLEAARRK